MVRLARLAGAGAAAAVAVWLLPASVHIVDWPAGAPVRIAQFAPLWQLWALFGVAIAAAVAAPLALTDRALVVRCLTPYNWLWLWAVPYLPWLPDRAPALLALAGPLRWGILALAVWGSIDAVLASRGLTPETAPLPGRRTLFAVSFALYLGFGLWSAEAVGPGADEPHYLVITQSLLRDHDLAIENNHARGDYREYFDGDLQPDFLRRGLNEVIYSIHAPGLPALIAPAFAVAGYRGAVVMLCLMAAFAALAVFDLAALVAGPRAGWFAWKAVCLTVPFVPHAWLIFPEMPGALLTAWGAVWLVAPLPERARTWVWRGLALGLLPWLHTKFVVLLAALIALLCVRLWRRLGSAVALVAPAAVSSALWLYSFYALYGVFDPQIPYGDFPKLFVLVANIPRGVLGLLFDQKFGLLPYAPVYLLALAGGWLMLRRPDRRLLAIALLATIGAFVASSTRMYMWWGGSSAPARFLVPILPLAAPMIATAFAELRSPALRALATLLLAISVITAAAGVIRPGEFLLFSSPHGLSNMAAAIRGGSPLPLLLPTFTEEDLHASLVLLTPWLVAALLALVVTAAGSRAKTRATGTALASAVLVVFFVSGAMLAGSPASDASRRAEAQRGRQDLLAAFDGSSQRAFDYGRRAKLDQRRLLDAGSVVASRSAGTLGTDPQRLAGSFALPAGRFRATFALDGPLPAGAGLIATLDDGREIARGEIPPRGPAQLAFTLPVDAVVWLGASDQATMRAVQQVEVAAESVVPRRERPAVDVRALEPIAGRRDAYIVYVDDRTYPEGGVFWTQGTHAGSVLVAPAGASTLVLTIHVGAVGGDVHMAVGGEDRSMTLAPGETRAIELPVRPDDRLVPIVVRAEREFRPSDREPGSTDRRWLGCQIRVGLR